MTNKKILIIKQLAVFLCGIVLSVGEVTQPESAIPEIAGISEPGRNFTFRLGRLDAGAFTVDSGQETLTVGYLKHRIREREPDTLRKYMETRIIRDGVCLTNDTRVNASDILNLVKVNLNFLFPHKFRYEFILWASEIINYELRQRLGISHGNSVTSFEVVQREYNRSDIARKNEIEQAIRGAISYINPEATTFLNAIIEECVPEILRPTDLRECYADLAIMSIQESGEVDNQRGPCYVKFEVTDYGTLRVRRLQKQGRAQYGS